MEDQKKLMIQILLTGWNSHITRVTELLDSLTDEQLEKETAPNRNRGVYLLGHLTAVHDSMLPLLGFKEQLHPSLNALFITSPDKSVKEIPSAKELRAQWNEVNEALTQHFNRLQPDEWFQKHTAVSEEDFKKEPHRNKINILIGRTNHMAYHLGQMAYLKDKSL